MSKCTANNQQGSAAHRMRLAGFLAIGFMFAVAAAGCRQPLDERHGFRLSGESAEAPASDWGFTNAVDEIFVQTTPWYQIPHSTTIWCAELDGKLYVGSYGPDGKKRWEHNVLRNPKAKIRIAGKIYDVTIQPVTDDATSKALDTAYGKKYDMVDVFGEDVPDWWYYRVALRN